MPEFSDLFQGASNGCTTMRLTCVFTLVGVLHSVE